MATRTTIDERFDLDELAGSGGMGSVYRAWDRQTGALVALKVLRHKGDHGVARFTREAKLLSELDHPGIVRYVAHGFTDLGEPYLAMEWLDGQSLDERLAKSSLTVGETIELGICLCELLSVAHERGIVHRDLKPENIFLVDGALERVKLLDFGIAHVMDPGKHMTATGSTMGTPAYMAPEQIKMAKDVDVRADIYGLGTVLHHCLTGQAPFAGESTLELLLKVTTEPAPRLAELRPDATAALDELVAQMLAKRRDERPPTAESVAQALRTLAADREAPAQSMRIPVRVDPHAATEVSGGESEYSARCLVLARPVEDSAAADGADPVRLNEEQLQEIAATIQPHGALADLLNDGTVMVRVPGRASLRAELVTAARCALQLGTHFGDLRVALVAESQADAVGDEARQRASRLVEASARPSILVDDAAAKLLGGDFTLEPADDGHLLSAAVPMPAEAHTDDPTPSTTTAASARTVAASTQHPGAAEPPSKPRSAAVLAIAAIAAAGLAAGIWWWSSDHAADSVAAAAGAATTTPTPNGHEATTSASPGDSATTTGVALADTPDAASSSTTTAEPDATPQTASTTPAISAASQAALANVAEACRKRCLSLGQCAQAPGGGCRPESPAHCELSRECKVFGRCTLDGNSCVVGSDADCRRADNCRLVGRCARETARSCRPGSDDDCRQSQACRRQGKCAQVSIMCQPTTPEHCRKSLWCRTKGKCRLHGYRCMDGN